MDVYTTQPGVQFYTGNFLNCQSGKGGVAYGKHSGLCLETQNYPDAPNKVTRPPHPPSLSFASHQPFHLRANSKRIAQALVWTKYALAPA